MVLLSACAVEDDSGKGGVLTQGVGSGLDDDGDGSDDSDGEDDGSDGGSDTGGSVEPSGLCFDPAPDGAPQPPAFPSYTGGVCPQIAEGYNTGFLSVGRQREFAFILPTDYDPARSYPLVFGWYHLNGSAMDFVAAAGVDAAADWAQSIIVVPQDSGEFQFIWPDTPLDVAQSDVDLTFFDDLLACVTEQYNVNRSCVASIGVSAGGLWTAYLGTQRGQYLASNQAFSGGYPQEFGAYWWQWNTSPHKFASVVLWGGPTDELIINFDAASRNYLDRLRGDGHFAIRCEHDQGHGLPPLEPTEDGNTPFAAIWEFVIDHPYWLEGTSLYQTEGLPGSFPSFCQLP